MPTAILVKRIDPGDRTASLDELEELAASAGYEVLEKVTQVRPPDRAYGVGKGKAEEIAAMVEELRPDKVIFDDKLSAVQSYNASKLFKVEAIDRFNLILEIFASRARTKESRLQVELASLVYEKPKARMRVKLARKGEQPGFKGLGKYEADVYESEINGRIAKIEEELSIIRKRQGQTRIQRRERGYDMVALAGYTNAGKSTLMHALTGEEVVARDQLFTTLVPTTRVLDAGGRKVMLTDTVGFIRDLPHFMVEAFRSTLEEIFLADLILLVVDASEPVETIVDKLVTCHDTLWDEIGAVPVITAMNKCDRTDDEDLMKKREAIRYLAPNPVFISAMTGIGLDELTAAIADHLPKLIPAVIMLPGNEEGESALSWLYDAAIIRGVTYVESKGVTRIQVSLDAREATLRQIKKRFELKH